MFVDRTEIHYHDLPYDDHNPDFCTILEHKNYIIKLFHTQVGVGMSDRYAYVTTMEIFDGEHLVTHNISKSIINTYPPITRQHDINRLLQWIYTHA